MNIKNKHGQKVGSMFEKDTPIDELQLEDAPVEVLRGLTLFGESLDDWIKRKQKERLDMEAKTEHVDTVEVQRTMLRRSRQYHRPKAISPTEFSGFVKIYDQTEIVRANAERRIMETKGKYIFVKEDGTWHRSATVLNLMMIWTTKDVENVFKNLDVFNKDGESLGKKFEETPPLTTHNLNIFLCSKMKDMTPKTLTTSTGPIISTIYKVFRNGIKGKFNEGLIARKRAANSRDFEYILNKEIFRFTLDDLIAEMNRVTNEDQKKNTAKI